MLAYKISHCRGICFFFKICFLNYAIVYSMLFSLHSCPLLLYPLINPYHSFFLRLYLLFSKWHHASCFRRARLLSITSLCELLFPYADFLMLDYLSWAIYEFRTYSHRVITISGATGDHDYVSVILLRGVDKNKTAVEFLEHGDIAVLYHNSSHSTNPALWLCLITTWEITKRHNW